MYEVREYFVRTLYIQGHYIDREVFRFKFCTCSHVPFDLVLFSEQCCLRAIRDVQCRMSVWKTCEQSALAFAVGEIWRSIAQVWRYFPEPKARGKTTSAMPRHLPT